MKSRNLVTCLMIFGVVGPALAQTDRVQSLDAAPTTSATLVARNNVEILAGIGEGKASLSIGNKLKSGPTAWSLTFSSPVNKDGSPSEFANLDGLSKAVRTKFSLSWVIGEPTHADAAQIQSLNQADDRLCDDVAQLLGKTGADLQSFKNGRCSDNDSEGRGIFDLTTDERRRVRASDSLRARFRELERNYDCILWAAKDSPDCSKYFTVVNASATLGSQSFEFFNTDNAEKSKTRKTVWSGELSVAALHIPSAWLYRLAYRREHGYKASDDQLFCDPAQTGGPLVCQKLAGGPPTKDDKDIITLEARRNWGSVGLAPKISFDLESDVTGVELPVYLVRNKDGQLTGGLVVGWRNDRDDVTVGVFVGTPFKFL